MVKTLFLGVLGLIVSAPAYAHVGDHSTGGVLQLAFHFLSEPLHIGVLLVAIVSAFLWLRASRYQQKSKLASPRC